MRDPAGSAAAHAARWRKLRRGSFVLDLPSHHSITSSASNWIELGTSIPSALAVCMLITNSNLVDCKTGRPAGLAPLRIWPVENPTLQKYHRVSVPYLISPPASPYPRDANGAGTRRNPPRRANP